MSLSRLKILPARAPVKSNERRNLSTIKSSNSTTRTYSHISLEEKRRSSRKPESGSKARKSPSRRAALLKLRKALAVSKCWNSRQTSSNLTLHHPLRRPRLPMRSHRRDRMLSPMKTIWNWWNSKLSLIIRSFLAPRQPYPRWSLTCPCSGWRLSVLT